MSDDRIVDGLRKGDVESSPDGTIFEVKLRLCRECILGDGGECNTPGCDLIRNAAPDLPLLQDDPSLDTVDVRRETLS